MLGLCSWTGREFHGCKSSVAITAECAWQWQWQVIARNWLIGGWIRFHGSGKLLEDAWDFMAHVCSYYLMSGWDFTAQAIDYRQDSFRHDLSRSLMSVANLHKWGLAQSSSCDCGQRQTMNHIFNMCPLTKFEGGLNLLHKVDDDAVTWLESTVNAALAK